MHTMVYVLHGRVFYHSLLAKNTRGEWIYQIALFIPHLHVEILTRR